MTEPTDSPAPKDAANPLPCSDRPPPAVPDRPITDEEWIAASQACCGATPDDDDDTP